MKKKQSFPRQFTDKKWQKYFGIVCILGLMLIGIVTAVNTFQNRASVSAHPAQKITIGKNDPVSGINTEYEVPVDAIELQEDALKIQTPKYDDFVQGEDAVPNTTKNNVTAYGSNDINGRVVYWSVNDIRETDGGNYLVLFGSSGNERGGVLKLSVFNAKGVEICTKTMGTLENSDLRVTTGFYESQNNNFLFGTSFDTFFKCTVAGESSNSATINLEELSTAEASRQKLKIHGVYKVGTETRSNGKPIITGPIYPNFPLREGMVKGRVPVGALDNNNWESGSMSADVDHLYSLENMTFSELGYDEGGNEMLTPQLYINGNGIVYGRFVYDSNNLSQRCETVQIFSQEDVVDSQGNTLKKRKYYHFNDSPYDKITMLSQISNNDYIYFLSATPTVTHLMRVDLSTFQETVIRTFPQYTKLLILPNNAGTLSYYGSTRKLEGEFYSQYYSPILNSSYYYVQGVMEGFASATPAKVKSLRAMEISNVLRPSHVVNTSLNEFLIGGQLSDYQKFPDKSTIIGVDGGTTEGIPKNAGAFIGRINVLDDNSPAISPSKEPTITVDITDNAIANPKATTPDYRGWSTKDRWLITGTKDGTVNDNSAIKVHDEFDKDDPMLGATPADRIEWLQRRINRNPNKTTDYIEWSRLGFNENKAGAQLVTYFVTDSQGQTSTTSRWINKKTSQTIDDQDNKFALDALNFHVALDGISAKIPDADTFKRMAKTTAWDLVNHVNGDHGGGLDEDGEENKLSGKVTVDSGQLQALRDATVAKPYPVDVTYDTGVSGIVIKNRVWVFVTTKNTIPNTETKPTAITPKDTNGVVYYADDYTIPYRLRKNETNGTVLTTGNVKVYDYFDASNETSAELPTLADATKNANKLVVSLPTIHNAPAPGKVTPSVTYKWDGALDANHKDGTVAGNETVGYLDIDLTADALFHVRQVVLDASGEIVVPTEGYFDFKNVMYNAGSPAVDPNYQVNLTGKSDTLTANPAFTTAAVATDKLADLNDQLQLSVVVPEFYQYMGYYYTTDNGSSHAANTAYTAGLLQINKADLNNKGEFWVTMYLKPNVDGQNNTKTPQPYSWDYEKNDLGKIKP